MGLTSGVGLASSLEGRVILEVSCFAGHAVAVHALDFTFQGGFRARLAVGQTLAVVTVGGVLSGTSHLGQAGALSLFLPGARRKHLEAQHGVAGPAQLAVEEVVPLLIVGILFARGAGGVLVALTLDCDFFTWRAAGAA